MSFCMGLAILYGISLLIVVYSKKIVSWHARMIRFLYPDIELVDRVQIFNPPNLSLVGKFSDYANKGPEHPEYFPRMIWFFRIIGLIPMIGCTIVLIYTIFGR